jgi:hypothetical protein
VASAAAGFESHCTVAALKFPLLMAVVGGADGAAVVVAVGANVVGDVLGPVEGAA